MFDYLDGTFKCVSCGAVAEAWIQTKLFDGAEGRYFRVGDSDYIAPEQHSPLHPWVRPSGYQQTPLTIVVGDWDCSQCGLGWQWAKLGLTVRCVDGEPFGTIKSLETFVPKTSSAFDGVHFVESYVAEFSGLWGRPFNGPQGDAAWLAHSIEQRCALMVAGYKIWCKDVAHIDLVD